MLQREVTELKLADKYFKEAEKLFVQNTYGEYFELYDKAAALFLKLENWRRYLCLARDIVRRANDWTDWRGGILEGAEGVFGGLCQSCC